MMPFRGEPSCDDGLACTAFGFDVELQAVTFRCVRFTYNPLTTGGRDGTPCNWWSQQDNAACLDNYECVPAEVLPPNFIPGGSGACTQMCSNNFDCPEGRRCDFHYKRIDNDPLLYAEGDFGRCIL
jgi:hypothetical protein